MFRTQSMRTWTTITAVLALGVSTYLGIQYFVMGASSAGLIINKISQHIHLSNIYYILLYLHIATGIIALATGWFQFIASFRKKHIGWHRIIGKVYSACVLFSGLFGIFVAFKATGGWISTLAFLLLSLSWIYTLIMALQSIVLKRDPQRHGRWMLRNYALTLAAVTLRIYLPICMLLFGFEDFNTYYRAIAWLCWIPNLIFAEWIIARFLSNKRSVSSFPH